MRKRLSALLFLCVLLLFTYTGNVYGEYIYSISTLENNVIKFNGNNANGNIKVMVEKDKEKYYYNLNKPEELIPMQLGKGNYSVKVLEKISGNKYKVIGKKEINVIKEMGNEVFLNSSQPVYWKDEVELIKLTKNIVKDKNTEKEKVEAVYNYVINSIEYDYNKINNINDNYVPELDKILSIKKGICYDYASLLAGMLRSEGIPTKLVKGYKDDLKEYHAWNEVFLEGKWQIIDTTYDSALKNSKHKASMIKSNNLYTKVREY
ncbi:MAG TPA: transglutaminase-like domain-containing protein [Tissierellaceae bacterium]|nr:transglutaminase-like domain-containing protein [Tissierellaceae bacterium]